MNVSGSAELCQICNKVTFKYVCPRCNKLYCSVPCYKSKDHSECSESFYRECVVQEMSLTEKCGNDLKNMYEILNRNENQTSATDNFNEEVDDGEESETIDSDDEADLEVRLMGININNADDVWEKLTTSEKLEFESLLRSGDVNKLVPCFTPWWEQNISKKLIVEITDDNHLDPIVNENIYPQIIDNISSFEKISIKPPAPCVYFNLTNIIASYVLTVRFFNGDHHSYVQEASSFFTQICGNIKSNTLFDSEIIAIQDILNNCQYSGIDENTTSSIEKDVNNLMQGSKELKKRILLSALSDIHRMLSKAKDDEKINTNEGLFFQRFKDNQINNTFEKIKKSKLKVYNKKIEYYLSFVEKYA